MEQIINYRDIPTDKRIDILNALERIGFFPAYGGVKTMQQIMEKSVPGSGPQFYFVFRENELIGYNFLIGDTKKYKAFPWLAISNMDEQMSTYLINWNTRKLKISNFHLKRNWNTCLMNIPNCCRKQIFLQRKLVIKSRRSDVLLHMDMHITMTSKTIGAANI